VDIVGPCAAGRGRPRSELRSELGRGRQRRARGMCPHTPRPQAGAACARAHGRSLCACVLCTTLYYTICATVSSRAEIGVCAWSVCRLKLILRPPQATARFVHSLPRPLSLVRLLGMLLSAIKTLSYIKVYSVLRLSIRSGQLSGCGSGSRFAVLWSCEPWVWPGRRAYSVWLRWSGL
jgi:hypothetical protein